MINRLPTKKYRRAFSKRKHPFDCRASSAPINSQHLWRNVLFSTRRHGTGMWKRKSAATRFSTLRLDTARDHRRDPFRTHRASQAHLSLLSCVTTIDTPLVNRCSLRHLTLKCTQFAAFRCPVRPVSTEKRTSEDRIRQKWPKNAAISCLHSLSGNYRRCHPPARRRFT
jgi:hypothetical protein